MLAFMYALSCFIVTLLLGVVCVVLKSTEILIKKGFCLFYFFQFSPSASLFANYCSTFFGSTAVAKYEIDFQKKICSAYNNRPTTFLSSFCRPQSIVHSSNPPLAFEYERLLFSLAEYSRILTLRYIFKRISSKFFNR